MESLVNDEVISLQQVECMTGIELHLLVSAPFVMYFLSIVKLTTDSMPKAISLTGVINSEYDQDDGDSTPEVVWSFG